MHRTIIISLVYFGDVESRVQFFQAEKKRVGFSSFKQRRRE
jgi:hypothetical protein